MTAIFTLYGRDLPPQEVLRDAPAFARRLNVPEQVRVALGHAVAWDPENRPPSIAQFCGELVDEDRSIEKSKPLLKDKLWRSLEALTSTTQNLSDPPKRATGEAARSSKSAARRSLVGSDRVSKTIQRASSLKRILLSALLILITLILREGKPSSGVLDPGPRGLVVVVPDELKIQNLVPWKAESRLEQEIVNNIYGGLFGPKLGHGYERWLASDFEQGLRPEESEESALVRIKDQRYWFASGNPGTPGAKIDAYRVVEAWQAIATDPNYPSRNRFDNVIENLEATDPETLRISPRHGVPPLRMLEALSFPIFAPGDSGSPFPKGGGPFIPSFPPPSEMRIDLLPSPNYPSPDGEERPMVVLWPVRSARKRLQAVISGEAQVALNIPPYYLTTMTGANAHKMDIYNVWALVFSLNLDQHERHYLAESLNAQKLLDAFLYNRSSNLYAKNLKLSNRELLSPSIFPPTYEVFDCVSNLQAQQLLDVELAEIADRIADPTDFGRPYLNIPPPISDLNIAYPSDGFFQEGVNRLVAELREQLSTNDNVQGFQLTGVNAQDWKTLVENLADGTSAFDAALLRFEYDRRCDVSVHFRNENPASLNGGLFRWISSSEEGRDLQWGSGELAKLRNATYCDAAAVSTLRIIRAVYDVAPAKFLFTMPSLMVFDSRVVVDTNDEFVLAGMKDWRFVENRGER